MHVLEPALSFHHGHPGAGASGLADDDRPGAFISIRHPGFMAQGVEDTQSAYVRVWAPACENCTFPSVPEGTRVVVDQDVTDGFVSWTQDTWPRALARLRALCEDGDGG